MSELVFVGDRGMITASNEEKLPPYPGPKDSKSSAPSPTARWSGY